MAFVLAQPDDNSRSRTSRSMPAEDVKSRGESLLVVEDDEAVLKSLGRALRDEGYGSVALCQDPREVAGLVRQQEFGAVLLDLVMPHLSGEQVLATLATETPDTPVIVVTALDDVDTAVRCVKAGAFDYLIKPVDFSRLIAGVERALQQRSLRVENRELKRGLTQPEPRRPELFAKIVTRSPAMLAVFRYVESIARSVEPVLIVGETGVGKELVAQALHRASGCEGDLVCVNVAGIDGIAFADTLFGHARGAFTGADRDRDGLIEKASGGTLFLDEIGDLDIDMQIKLLRLIQEKEFYPLGSDQPKRSRCRVVSATNRDLRVRMRDGRFREDLYFRLHSHLIRVPPLRERMGDMPLLAGHFLREAALSLGKAPPTPPQEILAYLSAYPFPGNVRELRAMIHDAVARHEKGVLSLSVFLDHMDRTEAGAGSAVGRSQFGAGRIEFGLELPTLKETTASLFREALRRSQGNQSVAGRMLGVSRRTVNRYSTAGHLGMPVDADADNGSQPADP